MITVEQLQALQTLAIGIEETADQMELIAGGGGVELKLLFSNEFPEQSPEIVRILSAVERMNKTSIELTHLMRTVSALCQEASDERERS